MNTTRGFRRYLTQKKYKHALRKVRGGWYIEQYTKDEMHKKVSQLRDNLTNCSCYMCCNPRHCHWAPKMERLTIQERRQLDKYEDWRRYEY